MVTVTNSETTKKVRNMVSHNLLLVITLLASASSVLAYDPDPLQDFCVAAAESNVFLNGITCKDPKLVNSSDFVFKAKINIAGNTSNTLGFAVNPVTVTQFPALNTLGISLARVDYAPNGGLNSPHLHPRASEIIALIEGNLLVGFVTSNPGSKLFSAVLEPGDLFVFPKGLVHFQYNIGRTPAVAFAALGSQNPGVIGIASTVFGSNPPIRHDLLEKAFQVNREVIDQLQAPFAS